MKGGFSVFCVLIMSSCSENKFYTSVKLPKGKDELYLSSMQPCPGINVSVLVALGRQETLIR